MFNLSIKVKRIASSIALGSVLAVGLPVATVVPAQAAPTTKTNSAWIPYWNTEASYQKVMANADLIHTASPFWYRAASCSSVVGETGAGSQRIIDGLKSKGIKVYPTVTSTMTPQQAISCFKTKESRAAHINKIIAVAKSRNYDGIDFNYEHLALTTDPKVAAQVRSGFTAFVQEACNTLRANRKACVVTVMPRTDSTYSVWRSKLIPGVYDYKAIGAAADRVRVMAYDQHAPNTVPGPIAGYQWANQVANYTRTNINPAKVEFGIPLYGRDWSSGTAKTVLGPDAQSIARRTGAKVIYHPTHRAPTFVYWNKGVKHTVWYSDARSVADRYKLAKSKGFIGGALWAPSQETSDTWSVLRTTVKSS